jgi:iron only hydrogenase large subunit-like protein
MDLAKDEYDQLLGVSSGAADIFGASGGVMEAALRTAYELITGEELEQIDFDQVRGIEGLKEAQVEVGDLNLKVAVAHGLGNARKILDKIKAGEEYHFVEFMACPGGCIGGGGQPIPATLSTEEMIEKRINSIYEIDSGKKLRKSHENPKIIKLYDEFLGEPLGGESHHLLHTKYKARPKN